MSSTKASEIPDAPGLYAFYFDLGSRASLGLLGSEAFPEERLLSAKHRLGRRLDRYLSIARAREHVGKVTEQHKDIHLRQTFSLSTQEIVSLNQMQQILQDLDPSELPMFCDLLNDGTAWVRPLYIGLTHEQTLRRRYQQHRSNFERPESIGNFGSRLRSTGLRWDEVTFCCVKAQEAPHSAALLRQLEKVLQSFAEPMLGTG